MGGRNSKPINSKPTVNTNLLNARINAIKQEGEIKRLNGQINNLNNQLNSIRWRISQLRNQLANETINKDAAYKEDNVWRLKIDELKRQIATEEAKIPPLEGEIKKLAAEQRILDEILKQTDDGHRTSITTFTGLSYLLTDETYKNDKTHLAYYTDVNFQNQILSNTINDLRNKSTTYDQKTAKENNNNATYAFYSQWLLYIYYAMLIILLYFIYTKQYFPNKYMFATVAILLGTYPFYILRIEQIISSRFAYIWALMRGEPYTEQ
jgi:cell division protein FtsL